MKHDQLRAIAHNLADSVAGGVSFVLGVYGFDIFGEAADSPGQAITIDFLAGTITEGSASPSLVRGAQLAAQTLPDFYQKHGASLSDFAELSVRFYGHHGEHRAKIAVTDSNGQRSVTAYSGMPLKRIRTLDPLGRIRKARRRG